MMDLLSKKYGILVLFACLVTCFLPNNTADGSNSSHKLQTNNDTVSNSSEEDERVTSTRNSPGGALSPSLPESYGLSTSVLPIKQSTDKLRTQRDTSAVSPSGTNGQVTAEPNSGAPTSAPIAMESNSPIVSSGATRYEEKTTPASAVTTESRLEASTPQSKPVVISNTINIKSHTAVQTTTAGVVEQTTPVSSATSSTVTVQTSSQPTSTPNASPHKNNVTASTDVSITNTTGPISGTSETSPKPMEQNATAAFSLTNTTAASVTHTEPDSKQSAGPLTQPRSTESARTQRQVETSTPHSLVVGETTHVGTNASLDPDRLLITISEEEFNAEDKLWPVAMALIIGLPTIIVLAVTITVLYRGRLAKPRSMLAMYGDGYSQM